MNQYAYFEELPVGTTFYKDGNTCKKVSTRTALLVDYDRWFYFRAKDLCTVGVHSRLAPDYFGKVK